ncbi:MAG: bifunctional tetrahydrofolate synthase/dihydrofolate synthase [Gammaproteobacteria bacterium]|nr:bifunctional tetrahydrofolate synthase/dihydrofolate synthase [Gammaproteobacteria bacterium]
MIEFKSLSQWLEWLESSHPITDIELGLNRITQVAKRLNLLKPKVPVISVAGTNGKGSVVASLESLAKSHQLNIGSYTSPHLIKFNERIKVNSTEVSDDDLCAAFMYIANNKGDIKLTYFEFTTLVALYCFSKQKLDFIALEVGLGGRFDATNIIDADVAVITSIGLDHTDWLGDSLEKIAYEKAGIARSNKPLVIADQTLLLLLGKAITEIDPEVICESKDYQIDHEEDSSHWNYQSSDLIVKNIKLASLYISNQAAALTAFSQIFHDKVEPDLVREALENANLLGRFSKLSEKPQIILDVAHNPDSALLLNQNIAALKSERDFKVWAICGMLKDKDITSSLQHLTSIDHWLCIDLPEPRGAKGSEIETAILSHNRAASVSITTDLPAAYNKFRQNAAQTDLLVVFGSFVTVGQMIEYWNKNN